MRQSTLRDLRYHAGLVVLLVVLLTAPGQFSVVSQVDGNTAAWPITFEEVSQDVGLSFRSAGEIHDPDEEDNTWPALPEIVGAGACWADFDGDGYEDVYVANQRYNDENPYANGYNALFDPTNRLYVNEGDGMFTDRTVEAGVESRTFDYGCSGVDYDGDGHVDLVVYGFGHVKLYQNTGRSTFSEVTDEAGVDVSTACLPYECFASCSAWVDYDGDGWLDLFVCTFVESDMEDHVRGPGGHVAQHNFLFRNNGDGTFTEVADQAGVQGIAADDLGSKSWSAVWFDADLDGWPDLYVANDMTPNEFYWNNGDGTFTRDDQAGLYDDRAGMGVASGDTTGSGYPDLFFTHYQSQHNGYYENRGDGTFEDRSGEGGLANAWLDVGWGTHFVDLARDGYLDIVAVNGHVDWRKEAYGQKSLVFRHEPSAAGSPHWVDVSNVSGPGILEEQVSRGAAFADYDLEGNMDLLIGNNANQSLQFLRGSGNTNHWLYVQPVQSGPNHQAVGARVVVETPERTMTREVQAGASFLSQNTLLADFGLGPHEQADRVTVHWPQGGTTTVEDVPADRVVRLDRETGGFTTDTLSPRTTAQYTGEHLGEGWYRSGVEAALSAQDRAVGPESGLTSTEYRLNDGPWIAYQGDVFEFPFEEGEHHLEYRSVDQAGNGEPVRRDRIGIDLTPPETDHGLDGTPASNGWWEEVALDLTASDALSGIRKIEYREQDGPWSEYKAPIPFDEGTHLVAYRAWDQAGNVAPVSEVQINVDATPPEAEIQRPETGTIYLGNESIHRTGSGPPIILGTPGGVLTEDDGFLVDLFAQDETSGIHRVDLFLDGEPMTTLYGDGPYVWIWNTTHSPSGDYSFEAVAQDRAGHVALDSVYVVLVNATPEGVLATLDQGPGMGP